MTSTATARGKARKSEVTPYQMYIDGKFVDAKTGKTFDVYDPSTEGVIARWVGRTKSAAARIADSGGHRAGRTQNRSTPPA